VPQADPSGLRREQGVRRRHDHIVAASALHQIGELGISDRYLEGGRPVAEEQCARVGR
jgi:hypothetical protein